MPVPRPHPGRRRRAEAGLTLIEVLVAAAVVAIALLSHAATTLSGHRLSQADEGRSVAIQAMRQMLERLRADEDWAGLYARLRTLESQAITAGGHLPPTRYYADYIVPRTLAEIGVRVAVPRTVPAGGGPAVLREDANLADYGLPFDLNGDGAVDANAHDADYRALPIVLHFRYRAATAAPVDVQVHTWLTGER